MPLWQQLCIVTDMSTDTIPEFEEHHRLARALEYANIPAPEMADDLGLAKGTVYAYMAGTRKPKLGILKQWAQRCSVSWEWIAQGNEGVRVAMMRRLAALLIMALVACGGSAGTPTTTTATIQATTTTSTTIPSSTTTTTIAFSREARLAVGRCWDAVSKDFSTAVAYDSISLDVSDDLTAAQKACTEAERQLKADNGPEGSEIAKMLAATEKLNAALATAESLLPGGNFLNDDCPNKPTCPVTVLQRAVNGFGVAATSYVE